MTDQGITRPEAVENLARAITSLRLPHPTRVGIDGWSGAGKTTLADELAETIRAAGRQTLRASIDDFHRKGHKYRSMRGEWTPRLYYDEGYDYAVFREWLLEPLGPGGSRRCRIAMLDSFDDVVLPEAWHELADDTVVVVDGIFLLHPELAGHWDYLIWLDVDLETMIERARRRDTAWIGSAEAVEQRYRQFRQPVHELYGGLRTRPPAPTPSSTTATSSAPDWYASASPPRPTRPAISIRGMRLSGARAAVRVSRPAPPSPHALTCHLRNGTRRPCSSLPRSAVGAATCRRRPQRRGSPRGICPVTPPGTVAACPHHPYRERQRVRTRARYPDPRHAAQQRPQLHHSSLARATAPPCLVRLSKRCVDLRRNGDGLDIADGRSAELSITARRHHGVEVSGRCQTP